MNAGSIGAALGNAVQNFATHSAQAASNANGVSASAQAAQGNFNQNSANLANSIGTDRIAEQYAFNAAQAANANQFSSDMWAKSAAWNEKMWDKAAAWNEMMWQKNADWNEAMWDKSVNFNSSEAVKNRAWQQDMMSTAYQRAVTDMEKAGLNPILAVTGGGISTGSGGGSAASISNPSMGGASMSGGNMSPIAGHAASGGLLSANQASEGNYTGQMEYMGGMLGLLSAAISGISSATTAIGGLGEFGRTFGETIAKIFDRDTYDDKGEKGLWDDFNKDFNKHPAWFYDHRYDQ